MVTLAASKKAYVFTMIAILLVTLMLIYVSATYRVKVSEKADVQGIRINQINGLVADIENQYLLTALISVSQDTLDAMAETTVAQGLFDETTFLGDFENGVKTGDIGDRDLRSAGLEKTLPEFLDDFFLQLRNLYDIEIVYSIGSVDLYHHDPWWLQARTTIRYTLTDRHTNLAYQRKADVIANFSIVNLQDPLYRYASRGALRNGIEKSAYLGADELDAAQVRSLMLSSNYTPDRSSKAWSYLERFVGKDVPLQENSPALDCDAGCGIVSLLNPEGIPHGPYSFADYTYGPWKGTCQDAQLWRIQDLSGGPQPPTAFYLNGYFVGGNPLVQGGLFDIAPKYKTKVSKEDPPSNTCESG